MKNKLVLSLASLILLSGCAGSASHKVLSAHQAGDDNLSCDQLDTEIVKSQIIIDAVNADKDDVNGKDIIDGLLWFPFNLIAKSGNYKKALAAADERIGNMQNLKKDNNCGVTTDEEYEAATALLSDELTKLSELHKSGELTDTEYQEAKRKLLQ
ncbi:MAG: SHOCT domain-containing protein [Methylophagaceae bacterium]